MFKRVGVRWFIPIVLVFLNTISSVAQDSHSVTVQRWDVVLSDFDLTRNRFRVIEEQEVVFTGTFERGTRRITLNNLEDITDIRVSVDGTVLPLDCARASGATCVTDEDGQRRIRYAFPAPISNRTVRVVIEYTVIGALRIDPGGDQLRWVAIPEQHSFPVSSASVAVILPEALAPRPGIDPIEAAGIPANVRMSGSIIRVQALRALAPDEAFIIRIQFPHTPNARVPAWQGQPQAASAQLALINVGALALALLIGVGGSLFWFVRSREYRPSGRQPVVPQYLTRPPDNLPPALAATLVRNDFKITGSIVLGTILDLARRGYIKLAEVVTDNGAGKTLELIRRHRQPDERLLPYEQYLLNSLFSKNDRVRLSDLHRLNFVTPGNAWQQQIVTEMAGHSLVNPKIPARKQFQRECGCFVVPIALVVSIWGAVAIPEPLRGAGIVIALALLVNGVALWLFAPRGVVTRQGYEAQAKWRAFKAYLERRTHYAKTQNLPADDFERHLPYAVAFGLATAWIAQLSRRSAVDAPALEWYEPLSQAILMNSTGLFPSTVTAAASEEKSFNPFDFDEYSAGLSTKLNSFSDSFSSMLSTAASALESYTDTDFSRGGGYGSDSGWGGDGGGWGGGDSGGGGSSYS